VLGQRVEDFGGGCSCTHHHRHHHTNAVQFVLSGGARTHSNWTQMDPIANLTGAKRVAIEWPASGPGAGLRATQARRPNSTGRQIGFQLGARAHSSSCCADGGLSCFLIDRARVKDARKFPQLCWRTASRRQIFSFTLALTSAPRHTEAASIR
jgi:hypothetical protein